MYEDRDNDGRISPGDRRLMVMKYVIGGDSTTDPPTPGSDAKQNSIVAPGDLDCDNCSNTAGNPTPLNPLIPLSIVRLVMLDINNDGIYNEGDYLFDDRDHSDTVSRNDLMITGIVDYPAGSVVAYNDPDYRDRNMDAEQAAVPLQIYSFDQTVNLADQRFVWRHIDDGSTVGKYDPGEAIYLDGPYDSDGDGTLDASLSTFSVDMGDTRMTSVTIIDNGVPFFYPARFCRCAD